MDKKNAFNENALKIFGIAVFALTAICAVLATLSRTLFFDEIGYYQSDAILPKIFIALCTCFAVLTTVFCFIPKIRIKPSAQAYPLPSRIGALILGIGFATVVAKTISTLTTTVTESLVVWDTKTIISVAFPLVIQIFAAAHLLHLGISKEHHVILNVVGNICVILYVIDLLSTTYFDAHIPMNSPSVILMYLAMLSAMMLMINEARIGLGQERKSFHAFSAALATLFCAVFGISELFVYTDLINDPMASHSLVSVNSHFPIILFITIFAAIRLACICFTKQDDDNAQEECDTAEPISEGTEQEADNASETQDEDQPKEADEPAVDTEQSVTE